MAQHAHGLIRPAQVFVEEVDRPVCAPTHVHEVGLDLDPLLENGAAVGAEGGVMSISPSWQCAPTFQCIWGRPYPRIGSVIAPFAAAVRAEAAGDAAARSSLYLARVVKRPPRTYTVRLTALAVVNQSLPTDDFHRAEMC